MIIIGGEPSDPPYRSTNQQQAKEMQQTYAEARDLATKIMAEYAGNNIPKTGSLGSAERATPCNVPQGAVRETRTNIRKTLTSQ